MQTIHLEIKDNLYHKLISSGIDIQTQINTFLQDILDDDYPTISTDEAKKRVIDAIQRYKEGKDLYTPYNKKFADEMNEYIKSL